MVADPPAAVTVTDVTKTVWLVTVIVTVPYTFDPPLAVALTITLPLDIAVTRPLWLIVA